METIFRLELKDNMNYIALYVLVAGLAVSGFGLFKVFRRKQYKRSGIRVDGIVTDVVMSGRNYYPIVRYETLDGVEVVEEYSLGTSPPAFKKGERIAVLYKAENCQKFIIDNKKSEYIEFGIIAIGVLIFIFSGICLIDSGSF
jgi:hypothetical protein